ncbi:flagellar hook-basal body protein [Alkalicoccus chagannorensis]|uniref:flagellar hook-basal body protein n=1 Tax=Alkalicoccus chagannorensis TaxID=427072 RepID=UPI00040FFB0C|nr:flagellar hook-basal body protein [Alkalicoccus chagannorensis]
MNQAVFNSSVTMGQAQHKMDTVSDNMANLDTHGYKRRDTSFADLMFQQVNNQRVGPYEEGRETPEGIRRGSGAGVAQTAIRMEQGALQETGRTWDLALTEPDYFFEVAAGDDGSRRFTRDGAFYLSPDPANEGVNFLVDGNGENVLNADGEPVEVPATAEDGMMQVNAFGEVLQLGPDGEETVVEQLNTVNITRPQLLESTGENLLQFPDLAELELDEADVLEETAGAEVIQPEALEQSNVDMGQQMSDMIAAQRHYQLNASALNMTDQMRSMIANLR